jgi:hypothetical protein
MLRRLGAVLAVLVVVALVVPDGEEPGPTQAVGTPPAVEQELHGLQGPESPTEMARRDGLHAVAHAAGGQGVEPNILLKARIAADNMAVSQAFAAGWKELGPKPFVSDDPAYGTAGNGWGVVTGRMTSLAIHPADPTTVYAGAAGGGVWKSTDSGDHWVPVGDQLPSMAVGAVAIDPLPPHAVFVGTGESNTGGDNLYGTGVYRSDDAGATWKRVFQNIAADATVAHIEIDGGHIFVATSKGLFRSDDGGASYQDVMLPTNAAGTAPDAHFLSNIVSDVQVKPGSPNQVTAAVGWRRGKKSGSTPGALYRSTAGGAPGTFTRMSPSGFGTPSPNPQSTDPVGRVSLAYAEGQGQDHNVLWAVIQDAGAEAGDTFVGSPLPPKYTSLNGIYRSGDDGATWTLKATSAELAAAPTSALSYRLPLQYGPGIQAWYDQWIAVDPYDAERVLVGLEEIYQSLPGANAPAGLAAWRTIGRYNNLCIFTPCDPSLPAPLLGGLTTHPDQHAAAFTKLSNGTVRLFIGNDGGVWRQDAVAPVGYDNERWTNLNATLGTTQPYDAVLGSDGTAYLGLQDNGTVKITSDAKGLMVNGGDGFDVMVDPKDSKIAFGEQPFATMFRTKDAGVNWSSLSPGISGAQFDAPMEMDPRDPKHIVIAGQQVAESLNQGDSWTRTFDAEVNDAGKANNSISALAVEGAVVWAGFCGLCDVITDGQGDASRFHNGIANNLKDGCARKLGIPVCWQKPAATGLPNRYITDIAIDQSDPKTAWVSLGGYARRGFRPASGDAGHLYVTRDGGQSFTDAGGNLPDSVVNAITLRDNNIIVGTDVGVFVGTKGGSTFDRLGVGMPNAPSWDTELNPDGSKLIVATHGRGAWVYDFAAPAIQGGSSRPGAAGDNSGGRLPATGVGTWAAALGAAVLALVLAGRRAVHRRA